MINQKGASFKINWHRPSDFFPFAKVLETE
jgi:hypothetical protein